MNRIWIESQRTRDVCTPNFALILNVFFIVVVVLILIALWHFFSFNETLQDVNDSTILFFKRITITTMKNSLHVSVLRLLFFVILCQSVQSIWSIWTFSKYGSFSNKEIYHILMFDANTTSNRHSQIWMRWKKQQRLCFRQST